ncbi:MAG: bifunctional phosphoribosylaminoimidazolecarboxamide formyltransferase/IMP cyclohydrolase PurH, partial [Chloroflexi bacterium]|nr:bifunctional phosphoribosylaminoimidazolecarboxamide formyltransferase/IMP cyclohydrolase PurH [Chloroflexota bacterium]
MPRALMSVSDKDGIVPFAKALSLAGWEIVASGGTAHTLRDNEINVIDVADVTGQAEMLGGRVKTLHPAIHAGILAREHSQDRNELEQAGYAEFDLVVCNLYPFQKTIASPDVKLDEAIEKIDIGGVTLIRAAAKNFQRVTVLVDPADYNGVERALTTGDGVPLEERRRLAVKAFAHTRDYDTAIHSFLENGHTLASTLVETFSLALTKVQELRYGENSHQSAALYARHANVGPLTGELLQGKELSYNNLLDADAAWRAVSSFDPADDAAVVIVKHLNPTGIAVSETL